MGSGHVHTAAGANKRALLLVFGLTALYLVAEVVGGLVTGSLALLADAGHMLTDVAGIGLALMAIRFAERPVTAERTYGFYRVEILAALTNAVVLIGISLFILYEAYERFKNPPKVSTGPMLIIATIGLAVNLVGVFLLKKGSQESLNMKGAYFEVLSGEMHDLHVWTLTSGVNAMSVHVVIIDDALHNDVLSAVHETVTRNFKIAHVTVQVEREGWKDCESHL